MSKISEFNHSKAPNFLVLSAAFWLLVDPASVATAQIIPDTTLPQNSLVTPNGDVLEITGGTVAGGNQFHSFEEFSLPTGSTVFFNNPLAIENIISRVTGNSLSNIDGLIRANGTANLFLLNPNGIVFGKDASLNIGGSFIGSTANSIKFADGSEFSATNPQTSPLLTVSIPLGLQFGANAGGINVQGEGNNTGFNLDDFSVIRDYRPVGLQVNSGQTLALVGGNIVLEGGNITAEEGRIELGSVDGEGLVRLTATNPGWSLNYEGVQNFQDINLSNAASLEVSGNGGGNVQLQGKQIIITDGSAILADTLGDGSGGSLGIKASELLVVAGTSDPSIPFISRLSTDAAPGSSGGGGNINIDTGHLVVADGAQILSSTFGTGDTGNLNIKASAIELIGGSPVVGSSGLFTLAMPGSSGNGGNVNIDTESLVVTDGAQAATLTFSDGNAGNLAIKAKNIELVGTSPNGFPSTLLTNADAGSTGKGGNLTIETDRLFVADGAQILSNTFGVGDAGNLLVKAKDIQLVGISPNDLSSQISASVEADATGNGGNLTIETEKLQVRDGAQIAVATAGSGNAGTMQVRAKEIEIIGGSQEILTSSGIFASAIIGNGNGGDINIVTDRLTVKDGATISTSNFASRDPNIPPGQGKAGNIEIDTGFLEIDNTSSIVPSSITASTNSAGGGNITLNVQNSLIARNNSQISAETKGSGNGGDIQVTTDFLNLINGAQITTNSEGLGQAGKITVNARQINLDRGQITATSLQSGGGDINLAIDNNLILDNNSLISTSVLDSNGGGGNITINSKLILARNNSDIRANAVFGPGGNINITTELIFSDFTSDIDASSKFGLDGVVEINSPESAKELHVAVLPENIVDPTGLLTASCPISDENSFAVTGNGGIPNSPYQTQSLSTTWYDLRPVNEEKANVASLPTPLQEATATIVNANGELELVALTPLSNYRWVKSSCQIQK
jgi:filamentous hemagglutinin family protein